MRATSAVGIGLVLLLVLLSGCTYTLDPQSLRPVEPDPVIDTNSNPPIIPPIIDQNVPDQNVPVIPPVIDQNIPTPPPVVEPPVQPPADPTITLSASEVSKHAKKSNCWMIIHGNVYNLTSFFSHPGGTAFVPFCGKDGTSPYEAQGHSSAADALLKQFYLGKLNATIPLSQVSG